LSLRSLVELSLPKGAIALSWFNSYSGILLKTSTSALIFDPVEVEPSDIPRADIIVVTHEHYDHFEASLLRDLQKQTNALIITTPYVASRLKGVPNDKIKQLKVGESETVGKTVINAEYSDHPGNQPLTFMVTEDNVVIYHSSDSRPFLKMRELGERYKPDIALCTVGIAPGTSPRSGAEVAKLIKPKLAIPYHSDNPRSLREFAEILSKEAPEIKTKIVKHLEVYRYPE
jgi:L-ascorbate metabolism protein UlaG (beta-lactamase superfamily)